MGQDFFFLLQEVNYASYLKNQHHVAYSRQFLIICIICINNDDSTTAPWFEDWKTLPWRTKTFTISKYLEIFEIPTWKSMRRFSRTSSVYSWRMQSRVLKECKIPMFLGQIETCKSGKISNTFPLTCIQLGWILSNLLVKVLLRPVSWTAPMGRVRKRWPGCTKPTHTRPQTGRNVGPLVVPNVDDG